MKARFIPGGLFLIMAALLLGAENGTRLVWEHPSSIVAGQVTNNAPLFVIRYNLGTNPMATQYVRAATAFGPITNKDGTVEHERFSFYFTNLAPGPWHFRVSARSVWGTEDTNSAGTNVLESESSGLILPDPTNVPARPNLRSLIIIMP